MRIGICDDSENDRHKIHNWIQRNHPNISETCVFQFCSGEAVIEFLTWNHLDVLFLDCCMCGISGIECAIRIRKKDKKIKIIATTDYEHYAPLGYEAEIYRFILKKDFDKKIAKVFDKIVQEHRVFSEKIFSAKTDKGIVRLLVSDIVHIESILRKKDITLIDGEVYTVYSKMMELEAFFEPLGFVRTHNSYLINSIYISTFNNERIILTSGVKLPISRKHTKTAYDRLMTLLS